MNRYFKRATTPVALLLVVCLSVGAQVAQVEKVDLEMMKKIRAEGMERSQVMETVGYMTDVFGGRLTGSPGMKAANEWTKTKLAEWGLQNAAVEPWGKFGRGWSLDRFSAHVVEPQAFPLIGFPKAWTPGTNGAITAPVVFAEINSEEDFAKYKGKLRGAVVLTVPMRELKAQFTPPGVRMSDEELLKWANDEMGGAGGRNYSEEALRAMRARQALEPRKQQFFREEGAAVLFDISRVGDGGTVFVQGGGPRDKNAPQSLPTVTLTPEHYGRIARLIQKGIAVKVEVNIQASFHDEDEMAYNTVAEIPGTDKKDELVMLGAHLDGWHSGTGATDNAAGSAVVMEAVRILKALGVQPRRTIRIALWSGEEQGLLGSRNYVSKHFAERQAAPGAQNDPAAQFRGPQGPVMPKQGYDKFSAYFNLDNGTGKIRGVYLQGNEAVRPIFRAWLAPFRDLGASTLTSSNTSGTDHLAFDAVGLPGFQFIQDPVEYDTRTHHSNMDTYERLQAEDLKQASVIMAAFVYNAAMRDERLPRKPMPGAQAAQAR
ncbi:MAG: M20/M25/M40 family metallo-hydrolase [Acidobacteria bacterium]|nr:M20/M25/M40 family metallo-hydrolase [Acidobacteriota bacterium]MCW5967889.1 M20/M25/M40 family metallo-hydrolase [Blastocatellales bacterium]